MPKPWQTRPLLVIVEELVIINFGEGATNLESDAFYFRPSRSSKLSRCGMVSKTLERQTLSFIFEELTVIKKVNA